MYDLAHASDRMTEFHRTAAARRAAESLVASRRWERLAAWADRRARRAAERASA